MFLLLKWERGHLFHHYLAAHKILYVEKFRPHDVLASEAGAWLALSPLLHSIKSYGCRNFYLILNYRPHDVLASEVGSWQFFHHYLIADKILYVAIFN